MTWIDFILLAVWILFLAVGARKGGIWTGACVAGGFLGCMFVDMYKLPASSMMGSFPGSHLVATVGLFLAGLLVFIIPGWLLSKFASAVFLGVIDSLFGFLTGAFSGFIGTALALILIVSVFPGVEKWPVWKRSKIVRPFEERIEESLHKPHFQFMRKFNKIGDQASEKVEPIKNGIGKIEKFKDEFVDELKK